MLENTVPKIKKFPTKGARRQDQAHVIWVILTSYVLFNKGKTITYGELAELMGYESPQMGKNLAQALGIVSTYCLYNDLPPLSCIVVKRNGDIGWEGMIPEKSSLENEQKRVWNTDWHLYRTPTTATFRKVNENLTFNDVI